MTKLLKIPIIEAIKKNWPFRKPFRIVSDLMLLSYLKTAGKRYRHVDVKDFMWWIYYIKGWREPNNINYNLILMLKKDVYDEYKYFCQFCLDNPDVSDIIRAYYKKFPVQRVFGLKGFFILVDYIMPFLQMCGKQEVLACIIGSNIVDPSPWIVFRDLKSSNKKFDYNQDEAEKIETQKYYDMLVNKDKNLTLTDRGRKLLLSVEWGVELLKTCYWCVDCVNLKSNHKKLISEYDNCKTKEQRDELIRKYEPESFDPDFDVEYAKRKRFLLNIVD